MVAATPKARRRGWHVGVAARYVDDATFDQRRGTRPSANDLWIARILRGTRSVQALLTARKRPEFFFCCSRDSGDRHIAARRWCSAAIARYSVASSMVSSHANFIRPADAGTNGMGRQNGSHHSSFRMESPDALRWRFGRTQSAPFPKQSRESSASLVRVSDGRSPTLRRGRCQQWRFASADRALSVATN